MTKKCLLCKNCSDESEGVDGYPTNPYYSCSERELDGDKRFPYKATSCQLYENDTDIISLTVKHIPEEIMNLITWKVS